MEAWDMRLAKRVENALDTGHPRRITMFFCRNIAPWSFAFLFAAIGSLFPGGALGQALDPMKQWGQWRGPLGTGVAPHGNPPLEWSETKNVKWKIELPGLGHSSPIVWGELVFVTAAEGVGARKPFTGLTPEGAHNNMDPESVFQFAVMAISLEDGGIVWRRTLAEHQPHQSTHESATWASNSPVTDGEHLIAFFGSNGLYCLDMGGRLLWEKDLGDMLVKHGHGEGASPALYGETVIVNWDHEGESFIVALAKRTGEELWRQPRDEVTSWATPIVVEHNGIPQVVVSGTQRVRGYGLKNGEILWEVAGLPGNVVATPVAADGVVYAAGSYEKQTLLAIRLGGATGDITGTDHIAWSKTRSTPYVPSPILLNGWLYYLRHYQGILSRANAKTGSEPGGPFRLGPIFTVYSSPVAVKGRIYITDRNGKTIVISDGQEPSALALNELSDQFSASPAIFGENLVLRGQKFIYCLSDNLKETKNN